MKYVPEGALAFQTTLFNPGLDLPKPILSINFPFIIFSQTFNELAKPISSVDPWLLITGLSKPNNIAPLYNLGSNFFLNFFKFLIFIKEEILRSKSIGLNGIRIHIKAEVPRKLYWADKLGLLVVEDLPNSWGEPNKLMKGESDYTLKEMIKRYGEITGDELGEGEELILE